MRAFGNIYRSVKYVIITIIAFFIFQSCTSEKKLPNRNNQIFKENYTYFANDELKISLKYFADYDFQEVYDRSIKRSYDSRVMRKYFKKKYFVYANKTFIEPLFESALFIVPEAKFNKSDLRSFTEHKLENQNIFYQHVDSLDYTKYRIYPYAEQNSFLLFAYKAKNRSHFFNIKEFENYIFPSLTMGANYKKHVLQSPFDAANQSFFAIDSSLNYLAPVAMLEARKKQYEEQYHVYIQALATYTSFIENHDSLQNYLKFWVDNTKYRLNRDIDLDASKIAFDENFIKQLKVIADTNRVIMLNENHFAPKDRFMMYNLLDLFAKRGYKYLAIEAIWEDGDTLTQRGYPVLSSGFYTREPTMSNMIRKAISLGFKIINYDAWKGNRDSLQARNIFEKTIQQDSSAKVLVHAGIGHINETREHGKRKNMAGYFYDISGINPFTIDQLEFMPLLHLFENHYVGIIQKNDFPQNGKVINVDAYLLNNLNFEDDYFGNSRETFAVKIDSLDNPYEDETFVAYLYVKSEYEQHANKAIPISVKLINYRQEKVTYKIDLCDKNELLFIVRNRFNQIVFVKPVSLIR